MAYDRRTSEALDRYPGYAPHVVQGLIITTKLGEGPVFEDVDVNLVDAAAWLNDTSQARLEDGSARALRLLIIEVNEKTTTNVSNLTNMQKLFESADLSLAGLAAYGNQDNAFEARTKICDSPRGEADFFACFRTSLMSWTMDRDTCKGVLLNSAAFNHFGSDLFEAITSDAQFSGSPLFLGLMLAKEILELIKALQRRVNSMVKETEAETGTVVFNLDDTTNNIPVFYRNERLARRLADVNRKAISVEAGLERLRVYLSFLIRNNSKFQDQRLSKVPASCPVVDMAERLYDSIQIELVGVKYNKCCIANQLAKMNQVTSSQDSMISIQIARDTRRDGMSMITLAAVTLFFLPGTFVAAAFAMPPNSNQGGGFTSAEFVMYWKVTGPLTLVVMLLWGIWFLTKRRKKQSAMTEKHKICGLERIGRKAAGY